MEQKPETPHVLEGLANYLREDACASIANCDRSGVDERTAAIVKRLNRWADEVERIIKSTQV